ncbi:MAG: YdeI/OmpD-associated family protein [Chitinophagales bacterium]
MEKKEVPVFYPKTTRQWRNWLEKQHQKCESVWVVFHTKASGNKSLTWSEAVDEALCFGWIDSKKIKINESESRQFFSKRKPKSTWSKINKQKVERLAAAGRMSAAGWQIIEIARQNGWWNLLDEVEELIVPDDLKVAFSKNKKAHAFYETLPRSRKKFLLQQLVLARTPETRKKRIAAIMAQAG